LNWRAPGGSSRGLLKPSTLVPTFFLPTKTGRICHYRKCFPRVACIAQNCGRREHLNDDLQVVSLSKELIAAPPVTLWPNVVRRVIVPPDAEALLLTGLERAE